MHPRNICWLEDFRFRWLLEVTQKKESRNHTQNPLGMTVRVQSGVHSTEYFHCVIQYLEPDKAPKHKHLVLLSNFKHSCVFLSQILQYKIKQTWLDQVLLEYKSYYRIFLIYWDMPEFESIEKFEVKAKWLRLMEWTVAYFDYRFSKMEPAISHKIFNECCTSYPFNLSPSAGCPWGDWRS